MQFKYDPLFKSIFCGIIMIEILMCFCIPLWNMSEVFRLKRFRMQIFPLERNSNGAFQAPVTCFHNLLPVKVPWNGSETRNSLPANSYPIDVLPVTAFTSHT